MQRLVAYVWFSRLSIIPIALDPSTIRYAPAQFLPRDAIEFMLSLFGFFFFAIYNVANISSYRIHQYAIIISSYSKCSTVTPYLFSSVSSNHIYFTFLMQIVKSLSFKNVFKPLCHEKVKKKPYCSITNEFCELRDMKGVLL